MRFQKKIVWLAMALCIPTCLWLGAVVSQNRDKHLGRALAQIVKSCCRLGPLLVVTDGWIAYKDVFAKAFRTPVFTGRRGHPLLLPWLDLVLV